LGKDVRQLIEGLLLAVAKGGKWRGWGRVDEGFDEISGGSGGGFGCGGPGHGDELREPSDEGSIGDAFTGRLHYPDGVATIVVHD
jgi:hypothetical protein